MTKDEILQAFRVVAMGRPNHPLAEQFAEKLEAVFAAHDVNEMVGEPKTEGEGQAQVATSRRGRRQPDLA